MAMPPDRFVRQFQYLVRCRRRIPVPSAIPDAGRRAVGGFPAVDLVPIFGHIRNYRLAVVTGMCSCAELIPVTLDTDDVPDRVGVMWFGLVDGPLAVAADGLSPGMLIQRGSEVIGLSDP